jgi:hypothetical protein
MPHPGNSGDPPCQSHIPGLPSIREISELNVNLSIIIDMKTKTLLSSLLTAGLALMLLGGCASEQEKEGGPAAKAKVSRADAEKIALSRVPGGTIKKGEIEEEHGRLVWAFDIATPGTPGTTEVAVDAMTGTVVKVDVEK